MGSSESNFISKFDNSGILFDTMVDTVFLLTTTGEILRSNSSIEDLLGYSKKEIVNQNISDIITQENKDKIPLQFQPLQEGEQVTTRRVLKHKNGKLVNVEICSSQNSDTIISVLRDITDQIETEKHLEKSKFDLGERVKELKCLYQVSNILWASDVEYNDKFDKIVNIIVESWQYPKITHCRIRIGDKIYLSRSFKEGDWVQEAEIILDDHPLGLIQIYISEQRPMRYEGPFLREERQLINNLATKIGQFIRSKKMTESLLENQNKLMQAQKMEAIGQLAGGMAHDLNNILMIIMGYAEKIETSISFQETMVLEDIYNIKQNVERASTLLNNLLTFSKRQDVKPRIVDVNQQLNKIKSMLHRLIGEDITLNLYLEDGINRIKIDPVQLDQIIVNLVLNARQAMPRGGKLSISTQKGMYEINEEKVRAIRIKIKDSGIGIKDRIIDQIFNPYFTTKEYGTGLGMTITKNIVDQNNGKISISSIPGEGTEITLLFPVSDDDPRPNSPISQKQKFPDDSQYCILLVEDKSNIRNLISVFLEEEGHDVITTETAEKAMALSKSELSKIDLVISDIIMPEMNGVALIRELKKSNMALDHMYISGYSHEILAKYDEPYDQNHYLKKPFTRDELLEKISAILAKNKS